VQDGVVLPQAAAPDAVGEAVAARDAAAEAAVVALPGAAVAAAVRAGVAAELLLAAPGAQAALPSAAAWVFRRDRLRQRLAPPPAARFAHAMAGRRIALP